MMQFFPFAAASRQLCYVDSKERRVRSTLDLQEMSQESRQYPPRPILAVSVALRNGSQVLLVRRARAPLAAFWSFPGGVVELGERLHEAAAREVREETGLEIEVGDLIDRAEIIRHDDDGRVEHHFVIVVFTGRHISGEPTCGDDADAVKWVDISELPEYELTPDTARILDVRPAS
jgi:8-oxo-dGTP diphosphatase